MIRSSKHSLKFTNQFKQEIIKEFLYQYRKMVEKYVNILWNSLKENPPSLLNNTLCQSIRTEISFDSRIRQCAAKQACSMVKSVVDKQNKRFHKLKKLQKESKNVKYLQRKIDITKLRKPRTHKIKAELDPRFTSFQEGNHFDLFIEVHQIGNKNKVRIPIQATKVSKRWNKLGELKQSIRLSEGSITLYFEVENSKVTGKNVVGADQGQLTCLTLSDGQVTKENKDGYDLDKIIPIEIANDLFGETLEPGEMVSGKVIFERSK